MSFTDTWKKITASKSYRPARITVPFSNIDIGAKMQTSFAKNEHYFVVRINEIFLSYKRQWFSTYDPVVFVTTEFLYNAEKYAVPFVVGPSMMSNKMDQIPEGMVFQDTVVAGLHPYRGGNFILSLVLGRMRQENYLRKIVNIIEKTAATYTGGFATIVSNYTKVANVVLDTMDALFDSSDVEPLIGCRKEFLKEAMDEFSAGYFILMNTDENDVDESKFFIKGNRLYYGDSFDDAEPFRDSDYVLYSILAAPKRSDTELLPFHTQFLQLQSYVSDIPDVISPEQTTIINAKRYKLQDTIRMSADLVRPQVKELINEYDTSLKEMINERQPLSGNEKTQQPDNRDNWEKEMDQMAMDIISSKK
jgi:hypothetical protein